MLVFLWGCITAPAVEESPRPISYEYDEVEDSFVLDIASIEEEVSHALSVMRINNSQEIVDSYYSVMSYADQQCPTSYEVDGNAFWYGSCQSDQGLAFDGYLFFNTYEATDLFSDGTLWDAEVVNGSTTLYHSLLGKSSYSGNAYMAQGVNSDGADVFLSISQGSFLVESAMADQLQQGWSPWLTMYGIRYNTEWGSANAISLNGSLPYLGVNIAALSFTNLLVLDELFGHPCPQEPMGSLSVRTTEGVWLDVEFDVSQDWALTGICDGCGVATTQMGDTYDFCVDVSPLVDWEETPW